MIILFYRPIFKEIHITNFKLTYMILIRSDDTYHIAYIINSIKILNYLVN